MTADRAALVEKVACAIYEAKAPDGKAKWELPWDTLRESTKAHWRMDATAAIDLIRAEVLEEAAQVADAMPVLHQVTPKHVRGNTPQHVAAAIRALKDAPPNNGLTEPTAGLSANP